MKMVFMVEGYLSVMKRNELWTLWRCTKKHLVEVLVETDKMNWKDKVMSFELGTGRLKRIQLNLSTVFLHICMFDETHTGMNEG
jgi:MarR-like DNA-binding transcriptional regulator SgrR of sgrS sRNA